MSDEDKTKLIVGGIALVFVIGLLVIIKNVVTDILQAFSQMPFVYGFIIGFVVGGLFVYFGIPAIIRGIRWIRRHRIVKLDEPE